MKLTKITRSKSYEMVNGFGLKSWDKFGLEADMSENENPIELYKELDAIIEQAHKESYQTISFVADNPPVPEVQVKKQPSVIDNMILAITTCTEVKVLETFRKLAKSNEAFQKAFDETMIKLTNKTN